MSESSYSGSCLCGAVKYEVTGEPMRFLHCHCSRCRKSTGTGHASNLLVKCDSISWTGETELASYKIPEAERYRTCFCRHCGCPMPREVKEMQMAVVPAGSLDCEPDLEPEAHIFWDSKATWSCSTEALPAFSEYPTG